MVVKDLDSLREQYPCAQTFEFGDNRVLCDHLIALVRAGAKTATCGALRDYPDGDPDTPVVGRQDIALTWDGQPAFAVETLEVTHQRFCDVTEDFALAEGENEDLAGWRRDHQAYFERNGGFDPQMMLLCERFRLVEDFA